MNSRLATIHSSLAAAAAFLLPNLAAAQEIPAVVSAGDSFVGVAGTLQSFDTVDVTNNGGWLIEGRTTSPHQVLLSSANGVEGQEGDPLPSPPMATITAWDAPRINNLGDVSHNILISGTESAVYWNDVFQLAEGDITTASEFTAGTPYVSFQGTYINDSNQMAIVGAVDDPNLGLTSFDSFLMVRDLDASGAVLSENVIVKPDDVLPGMTGIHKVESVIANGSHQSAINNLGDVMYGVRIRGVLFPDTNNAYYINDTTLVAREGEVEPLTGRVWKTLSGSVAMDLNDAGDYAYRGRLVAPGSGDWVVIKNNTTLLAEEGGTIPAIAPHTFREFTAALPSTGPVLIDNSGNVFWFGEWEDAGGVSQGRAIFRNQEILVEEGVATSGGAGIFINGDEFALSDNGRFLLFTGRTGGTQRVFLLDLLGAVTYPEHCFGDGGDQMGCTDCPCSNNAPMGSGGGCLNSSGAGSRLIASGNPSVSFDPASTDDLRFSATDGPPNQLFILNSGDALAPTNPANPCFGLGSGAGGVAFDGLRCAVTNTLRNGGRGADANGEVGVTNNPWGGESNPPGGIAQFFGYAAGVTKFFQCIHRDTVAVNCATGLNTTQAVEVTFIP